MTAKKTIYTDKSPYDDENVLSIYLKEINKIDLLTRDEENDYARKAANGDPASIEKIIKANLRFVVNVAKKYQKQGLPLSDLINEGNIGLMNAIERYDVDKGYHFISYAVWWIRQAILKAICEKSRMIRLPLNRANELVQIQKASKALQSEKGEDPDISEIARATNMKDDHVISLMNISRDLISLETPVYAEKGTSQLADFIEDEDYKAPEALAIENSLKADINSILATLTEKESKIIQYRFGLNGHT
ncbi:MAG: RNA polymerase sigma factor RpoD/SigA, partial [Bacteroidales bacterium]|nr:RNA polymerase sigma factor RpoD/SigA [Bacteroidales bacterium]